MLVTPPSPYVLTRAAIGGVEYPVFEHAPRNLGALYALSGRHDARVMLVYEDERYTFADVKQRAANFAHRLVHTYGVRKGERIALAMRNYPEWAIAYVAATSIGAVLVPLNAWWTGAELQYGIADSGAKLLIADGERFERVHEYLSDLRVRAIVTRASGELPSDAHAMAPLMLGEHALPAIDVAPDDDATILYTSGSTGHPKGVISSHRAIVHAVMTWEFIMLGRVLMEVPDEIFERVRQWASQGAAALATSPLALPQSSMLITLPLFHVTGCNVQFLPAFRNGRKLVLMHRWNPERALELIERERITDFSGVPTMSWELVNSPDFQKRDTSTLRSLSAGGASRPPEHVRQLRQRAQHAPPSTGYGMTETNGLGSAIGGDDYALRPASVGRALPPLIELKIIDDKGATLPVGVEGEICIKGVTNMRGYWNKPKETAATVQDGFVRTGDLGHIDAEGFLFITGRAKDIVIRGGENISCGEVEHALYEHPAVFEVAVYGVPDARLGEAVAATIMLRPGERTDEDTLKAHVAGRLALFKVPTYIFLQRQSLPRIASEKFDKRKLQRDAIALLKSR